MVDCHLRLCGWIVAASLGLIPTARRAADAPPAIDACALLTRDEVAKTVGRSVEAVQPYDNGVTNQGAHSTTCIWATPLPTGVEPDPPRGGRRRSS